MNGAQLITLRSILIANERVNNETTVVRASINLRLLSIFA